MEDWKPGAADHPPYKQLSHYKQTPAEEVPGTGQEQGPHIITLSGVSCSGVTLMFTNRQIWDRKGRHSWAEVQEAVVARYLGRQRCLECPLRWCWRKRHQEGTEAGIPQTLSWHPEGPVLPREGLAP